MSHDSKPPGVPLLQRAFCVTLFSIAAIATLLAGPRDGWDLFMAIGFIGGALTFALPWPRPK